MDFFISFLNKFNAAVGKFISEFEIPYPKSLTKKIRGFFKAKWDIFLQKIHRFITEEKYASEKFENLINKIFSPITITLLIIVSITAFFIYQLDQRAFFEGKFSLQKLENILAIRKPAFLGYEDREFYIPDVYIPVIIKDRPDITRVYLDIKLRASNKLIKIFFTENNWLKTDLITDRLLRTISPILATFPFTEEGKKIIKNKIKYECDQLLKELKIEGEIEEVIIQDILAA